MRKILAAVDLGADTLNIVAHAEWLASGNKAGDRSCVVLLHIMDFGMTPPAYLLPYIERERALAENKLKEIAAGINARGLKAEYRTMMGRLVETINTAIRETGPDMMVLGVKSHLIRPSSSERLIKSLDIPMLVVRGPKNVTDGIMIKNILCAVDFSETSLKALRTARELAEAHEAALTAVHVVPIEKPFIGWVDSCKDDLCRFKDESVQKADERLKSLVPQNCKAMVRCGFPHEELNNAASETGADIIISGARGLSYIKGIMIGSVSETLIKSASKPVMIIR
ncbi:MAG: universal stress protein [Nitrospirae bacterium]|nr:MAG: universal stress protein [Nitrospirota bacterium]